MRLTRPRLTLLFNALYESGTRSITVSHPGDDVGDLVELELGDSAASTLAVRKDVEAYRETVRDVGRTHGSPAVDDLPDPRSYLHAFFAGGLLAPANDEVIDDFLETHGSPDLSAGHKPVVAGFDTNLLPWRIADVFGFAPGEFATVNGFALATGVRDELDWDYKRQDTGPLEAAFGSEFERVWNQPAGERREGRLGEIYYRSLRDHRYAEELVSETGDEAIVEAYDEFQREGRKDVLLFSNDRDFVERARSHRLLGQRVELPRSLPESLTGSWAEIQDTLYVLSILFGVLKLPKVTLYGVWTGKGGQDWHDEVLDVECRSPQVADVLERDLAIVENR